MSEQKRAPLTTIGSNKKEKKVKEPRRTVRLKVNLSESNEKTCPEYNYVDLLNSVEKRRKKKNDTSHVHSSANGLGDLDPFADDDEEKLKEIARNFEERYGPTIPKKKCRKREDYMDIGAGYDETDPFIDNTDAYDEIVPEEMTTAHGGFYINSGALEYKRVEHNSDISDTEEIKNNKSKKKCKKILVSDEEEDDEEEEEEEDLEEKSEPEKKVKVKEAEEESNTGTKRKLVTKEPEPVIKKKRKSVDGLVKKKSMTVKDLLKEKRDIEKPETKLVPVITAATPVTTPVVSAAPIENPNVPASPVVSVAEPKKSPATSITDAIESVVSAARGQEETSSSSSSSLTNPHSESSESSDEEDSQNGSEKEKQPVKEEVKLPDNLPEDLKGIIVLLKNAAKTSVEGKCKFFSTEVNRLLLRIEQTSKSISVVNRNLVYSHLASYVPCTKDTLMKRAKKLIVDTEEDRLKEPMMRLKAMVEKMMPSIIEKHTKDCQTVAEEKGLEDSSAAVNAGVEVKNSADGKKVKSGIPLRVFPWNDEVRSLLCEVVKIKLQNYESTKPRKESAKDYLKEFFETQVKNIWPPGWMKTLILYRESRSVHCNTMTKLGKPAVAKKSIVTQPVNSSKPMPVGTAPKGGMPNPSVSTAPSTPSVSAATITPVTPISSSTSTTATSNISPSVSIIKCPTSQTITPSQRASSPSSRATITSVSSSPRVSSPLLINSSSVVKSKTVNNSTSNSDAETSKAPLRTKSSSESTRESVVTKTPVILPQVHLPDCISVTPAHSIPPPTNKSPSTPIMSLKQRILQDAAASSSKQLPDGASDGKSPPKVLDEDCEVLLVGEKREGKLNVTPARHSGPHHPKSHPISMGHKADMGAPSRTEVVDKDMTKKDNRNSCVPRLSPSKEDKISEGRLVDETVTATDVLSQIINSSLGGFPNASTISKGGSSGAESMTQRRDHHGERHPGMLSRNAAHDHENKEKIKDVRASQNSRVENSSAAVTDTEESVQLEVDRVMKELLELREMTEDSMESEADKRGSHFRPNEKTSSTIPPTHMLSSSVSVIAVNSASSKHHTANSQTKMNSSVGQISSSVTNSSQSSLTTTTMNKRSSSVPYGGAVNPIISTKSYGFQDEFQRHVLQDCGKNLVDGDGALYMGNKVHKDGERNRTANFNSVYQSVPQSSPAGLERNRGLHNTSVDGANDCHRVLMSISQLKNTGARHKQNNPPNAHQFTRHSLPTHNSSEMESCPNINFSGNCVKPRVSSHQFSRPEILTQSTNSQLGNFGKIVKHSNLLASSLPQYQGMKPYPMKPESSSPQGGPAPHSAKY